MAKSLVLHVGDPKTGTSSIQEVLLHGLWQGQGASLAYPDQLNSFPLANAIWDPAQQADRAQRWGRTADWLRACPQDVAVISAEQFFRVDPQALRATLQEFLPEYLPDLRIIAYVRPHAARLVSAFMQRTKAGLFLGDMDLFWRRSQRESLLTYAPRFQRWRDTFGEGFTLRPMIRNQLRDGDVVADFLHLALSGAPFTLKGAVEANTSLSLEHLAGLREVQAILKRQDIPTGTRHAVGDHVNRSLTRLAPGQGQKLQLSLPLYNAVSAASEDDAATLDRAFFGGQPLMAQALAEAQADSLPQAQAVVGKDHFPEETLQALRGKARNLVAMFRKRPLTWTQAFEREIGQRPAHAPLASGPQAQAHVTRANAVLDDIARLIAGLPPTAAGSA